MKFSYKTKKRKKKAAESYSVIQNMANLSAFVTGQSQDGLASSEEYAQEIYAFYQFIIANMSHDLRTPLTGVLNLANYLKTRILFNE